jgi:NAD(P)H-dependent FMN reductase
MTDTPRPFYLPVILGTPRKGRYSVHAARLVAEELGRRPSVTTEVLDVLDYPTPPDDAGEQAKNPAFAEKMARADGLVLVCPEYNHGYPGALKSLLDTCLKEYIHKPAGVVGVSGTAFGGTRAIQDLLPVLRELGLVAIFWDVNFGKARDVFAEDGTPRDPVWRRRTEKFLSELIWMATVLRHGREHVALPEAP